MKKTYSIFLFTILTTLLLGSSSNFMTQEAFAYDGTNHTTTSAIVTVPDAPTDLIAIPANVAVGLFWYTPLYDGGSPITGYFVEYRKTGAEYWSVFPHGDTRSLILVTGLTNGISHDFRVSTINSIGTSIPTDIVTMTPFVKGPEPPTNLSATVISTSIINLTWKEPSNNGGVDIVGYKIKRSLGNGNDVIVLSRSISSDDTSFTDTTVSSNTTYKYQVQAINDVGISKKSNILKVTTPTSCLNNVTEP